MPGDMEALAEYVRERREQEGLTVKQACAVTGLSTTAWYNVEKQRKASYRPGTLRDIARGLDEDPAKVFSLGGLKVPGKRKTGLGPSGEKRLAAVEADLLEIKSQIAALAAVVDPPPL